MAHVTSWPSGPNPWPGSDALKAVITAIEGSRALDGVARPLQSVADWLVAEPVRRDVLTGRWLGHAAHPFLTDIPIGSWTSASLLDVLGGPGARPSATLLTAIGTMSAVPTVMTGLAEWATTQGPARRVGVVHAASNVVATGLYAASWSARAHGRHGRGAAWALAGMTVATFGGLLGGHLVSVRKVSSHDPAFDVG